RMGLGGAAKLPRFQNVRPGPQAVLPAGQVAIQLHLKISPRPLGEVGDGLHNLGFENVRAALDTQITTVDALAAGWQGCSISVEREFKTFLVPGPALAG